MTIPKIRENAVKSFKNSFDFDVYSSLTTLESREDFLKTEYLIEFLFSVCPEMWDEYKKGLLEVKDFVFEQTLPKFDFSNLNICTFNSFQHDNPVPRSTFDLNKSFRGNNGKSKK